MREIVDKTAGDSMKKTDRRRKENGDSSGICFTNRLVFDKVVENILWKL